MRVKPSPLGRDVRAALSENWRTSREIWQSMRCWSPNPVKAELNRLSMLGVVDRRIEPTRLSAYQYRRKTDGHPDS